MIALASNIASEVTFLGVNLINVDDFTELVARFLFNLVITFIIIRFLYYRRSKRKDYLFTYFLISLVVFLLCILLNSVKLQLGFALGLFAIFGILRYRTNAIPIKEMTYLFLIIGVSVINALANKKVSIAEILFTNVSIIVITWGLEFIWLLRHETQKTIVYEKINLIKPDKRAELKEDIENRTGLIINRIEIGKIDFMRDIADVTIFYFDDVNNRSLPEDEQSDKDDDDDD